MILRPKTQSEQITIKDLQNEIKNLKQEIQILNQNDISLEYRLLELEGREILKVQDKTNDGRQKLEKI